MEGFPKRLEKQQNPWNTGNGDNPQPGPTRDMKNSTYSPDFKVKLSAVDNNLHH